MRLGFRIVKGIFTFKVLTDLGGTSLGCMGVSLKSGDPNLGAPGLPIWNIANFRKGRQRESGKGTSHS